MWICTNVGFISIVASDRDPSKFNVRARKREHLLAIFGPDTEVVEGVGTDYRWRSFVEKEKCADIIRDHILNISYNNFKNSVKDPDLHDLYADFWELHYEYQFRDQHPNVLAPKYHRVNYGKKH